MPLTEATQGLSETEASWGRSSASCATRCSRSSTAPMSTPGLPCRPNSVGAARRSRTIAPRRPWSAAAPGRRCRRAARWRSRPARSRRSARTRRPRGWRSQRDPGRRHRLDDRHGDRRGRVRRRSSPSSATSRPRSSQASAISSASSMLRYTLARSGRPRTACAVALSTTFQPSRSATAIASSRLQTAELRHQRDPVGAEQLAQPRLGQLAARGLCASTRLTSRLRRFARPPRAAAPRRDRARASGRTRSVRTRPGWRRPRRRTSAARPSRPGSAPRRRHLEVQ